MCHAQGHNAVRLVGLEPATPRARVKHTTTEPLCSQEVKLISHVVCLFDLILYVPSTIVQLNRDGSSWVEPVLSWDKCVLLEDHSAVTPVRLEPAASRSRVKHSTTEPLRSLIISHVVLCNMYVLWHRTPFGLYILYVFFTTIG